MNSRRHPKLPSCCNKMNILKLLLFGLCYFIWTREGDANSKKKPSTDWFQIHGLSCDYCRKKIFRNVLAKSDEKESTVQPRTVTITIKARDKKCKLDEKFLSFTLDTLELMRDLRCFPLTSVKINNIAKSLVPAYFRVGGTPQDFLYFKKYIPVKNKQTKDSSHVNCTPKFENWKQMKPFVFPLYKFNQLLNFTERNGLDLIFGLNVKLRDRHGNWDPKNANMILDRLKNHRNVHWALGNEPNRFNKYGKKAEVSSKQLVRDFKTLRKLFINKTGGKILGPDISRPNKKSLAYFKEFLVHDAPIDAYTYHLYDMHMARATPQTFLNPIFLDKLREEMLWITNLTKATKEIWVGEAGSASGGGAPNLSDRFISGFFYLGKLGLASELCHKVFIRQSFYGGYYGMLDPITHDPLPDYWSSLLFKRLISTVVLSIEGDNKDPYFRMHAYCSKTSAEDVVVMFININQNTSKTVRMEGQSGNSELYILTNQNDLQSRDVYLNGELLKLKDNYIVPDIKPLLSKHPIDIPPLSYGFVVLKDILLQECIR